ncbi:lipase family protein [Nocardia sp. CA-128927]|uniref:lipase family protein n=1 Tax=Nocardia sp. CA-128927 TaxID=3239975 RepID=UPI003D95CA49
MTDTLTEDDDLFFAAEPVEPNRQSGDLLRMRKTTTPQLDSVSDAWQVVYVSSNSYGELTPASGMVIAPDTAATPGALLVYCPAFHGLGGVCAPSQQLATGTESEADLLARGLERGWTVAVPDGQGLGLTGMGPHTFLAGRAAGHTTLDIARAAQRIPDLDLDNVPIGLWGYADGGRAALWAGEIQPQYASELDLRGIAAGATVSDPGELIEDFDGGKWSALTLAGLIGLGRAYAHLPMLHVLTAEGHLVAEYAETLSATELLATYRRQPLARWCERPDPWNDPMWKYVLARERCGIDAPKVPVHLYHGSEDTLIPVTSGRRLFRDYRDHGVDLSWREYPVDNQQAAIDGAADAIARLTAYLQRAPSPQTRPAPAPQTPTAMP